MKRIFNLGWRTFMDWRKIVTPLVFASLFCISTGTYVSAQTVTVNPGNGVVGNTIAGPGFGAGAAEVSVEQDGTTITWNGGSGNGGTIQLGDDLTPSFTNNASGVGVLTNNKNGGLVMGDYGITVLASGSNALAGGYLYYNVNDAFVGTISKGNGGDISVGTSGSHITGSAIGLAFISGMDGLNYVGQDLGATANISTGDINVYGTAPSRGFFAGNLANHGSVALGNIVVETAATGRTAWGIEMMDINGTLSAGDVTVESGAATILNNSAHAVHLGSIGTTGAVTVGNVSATKGNLTAGDSGHAFGITIDGRLSGGTTYESDGSIHGKLTVGSITVENQDGGAGAGDGQWAVGLNVLGGINTGAQVEIGGEIIVTGAGNANTGGRAFGILIEGENTKAQEAGIDGVVKAGTLNLKDNITVTNADRAFGIDANQLEDQYVDVTITATGSRRAYGIRTAGSNFNGDILDSKVTIGASGALVATASNATYTKSISLGGLNDTLTFDAGAAWTNNSSVFTAEGIENINFKAGDYTFETGSSFDNATANVTINAGATVDATAGSADYFFGRRNSSSGVVTDDGPSLTNNGTFLADGIQRFSGINGVNSDAILNLGSGTLWVVNADGATSSYDGTIVAGMLRKHGSGTQIFGGNVTVNGNVNLDNSGGNTGDVYFLGGVSASGSLRVGDGITVAFDAADVNEFMSTAGAETSTIGTGATIMILGDSNNQNGAAVTFANTSTTNWNTLVTALNGTPGLNDGAIDNTYSQFGAWEASDGGVGVHGIYQRLFTQVHASDVRLSALMMHSYNSVFNASNDRMTQNFNYWDSVCGTRSSQCGTTCGSSFGRGLTHSAWVNYVGRSSELQSSYDLYNGESFDIKSNGVQVGLDLVSTRNTQFGVMFGYEDQKSEIFRDSVNADDYYFGIYGARRFNSGFDVRGSFGYGTQDYDMSRYSPLVGPGQYFRSDFDGNTYELNFELGRRFYTSSCFSYRPVLGFDFYWNELDGASETPVDANHIRYGKTKFNQALVRIGSDAQWNFNRLNINGGLYYSYDMADDGLSTRAYAQNGTNLPLRGSDLGTSMISLNIGGQYYLNQCKTFAAYGGYNADFYLDRDGDPISHTWNAGVQYRF